MSIRILRIAFVLTLLLTSVASALKIEEQRWGFDGTATPGRFNILSVRVSEPGQKPFDGELELIETRGIGSIVGAPIVQKIYVTPQTERWVQFTPFVDGEYNWILKWGKGEDQRSVINAPSLGPPATVLMVDVTSIGNSETRLKSFGPDLFPTSVAATDGLDQIVIDQVPRWDAPRRESFMDWVRRGGVVHIIRGPGGFPQFDGELGPLNTTLKRERVGSGLVVRHDVLRSECDITFLKNAGFAPREKVDEGMRSSHNFWNLHQSILKGLAALTKPEVAWWLLYLLTIGYLVIIGPVHYRWSRTVDYRIAIGGFLGTVAVFAVAFIIAGRRGSGETQTAHSIAIARGLPGNRWDTMQWISAFATSGDYYRFTHESPVNYYSGSNEIEAVNGKVFSGKEGHFDVDIPLYSARPFLHRGLFPGPDLSVQVLEWKANKLTLQPGNSFPDSVKQVWARRNGLMLEMKNHGNVWVWDNGPALDSENFFNQNKGGSINTYDWATSGLKFEEAFRPLVATYLGDINGLQHRFSARAPGSDHLQLFVYAKAPGTFSLKGKDFRGEKGWVLFVQDVFRDAVPIQ